MAITYTPARQRTFAASSKAVEGGMDVEPMEPPRKRRRYSRPHHNTSNSLHYDTTGTHYEANTEMDWEPHPAVTRARPSTMFSSTAKTTINSNSGARNTAHSSGFLSAASNSSPFLFQASTMQVDEQQPHAPVASTSSFSSSQPALDHLDPATTAKPVAQNEHEAVDTPAAAQSRDIANGAVQRERRKRDQLKNWQVTKGKGVQVEEDHDEEEDTADEVDTSTFMESLSLSAPIRSFLVSPLIHST
jgi:hypothetical protein